MKSYSEQKAINEHFKGRHDVASAHEDTLKNAVDRVSDGDIESNPLSKKESTKLAKEIKNGDVDVKEHGVTNDLVSTSEIMNKAVKAGLTAATISAIIQTAPEIVKAFDYLIKTKQLDMDQVKKIGKKAFNASVDGFMIGSISCVLQIKIAQGLLGTSLQTAMNSTMGPTFLGTVVSLLYTTVKNGILVANGKMTRKEMGSALVDTVIISGGYIAGSYIGGIIGQALGFTLPVIGYMLGSLVGCSLAAVYNIGKKKLISLCVDSGLTFFGMVDQDYSLPEEVLNDMGIDYASITRAEISRTQVEKSLPQTDLTRTRFETVDIKILRRGIIGVNKIGYVI